MVAAAAAAAVAEELLALPGLVVTILRQMEMVGMGVTMVGARDQLVAGAVKGRRGLLLEVQSASSGPDALDHSHQQEQRTSKL